jgi:hypothetical protein
MKTIEIVLKRLKVKYEANIFILSAEKETTF